MGKLKNLLKYILLIVFLITAGQICRTQAQGVINEVMDSNNSTIADHAGDFEDWIELYNKENFSEF